MRYVCLQCLHCRDTYSRPLLVCRISFKCHSCFAPLFSLHIGHGVVDQVDRTLFLEKPIFGKRYEYCSTVGSPLPWYLSYTSINTHIDTHILIQEHKSGASVGAPTDVSVKKQRKQAAFRTLQRLLRRDRSPPAGK